MRRVVLSALLGLAGFAALASAAPFKCPHVGGNFTFGQEANINSLDQMTSGTISTRNIAMNIFESLMTRDENNNPILELAASMAESPIICPTHSSCARASAASGHVARARYFDRTISVPMPLSVKISSKDPACSARPSSTWALRTPPAIASRAHSTLAIIPPSKTGRSDELTGFRGRQRGEQLACGVADAFDIGEQNQFLGAERLGDFAATGPR